jgi:hypothetical protein
MISAAKGLAMTAVDLLTRPELLAQAKDVFQEDKHNATRK